MKTKGIRYGLVSVLLLLLFSSYSCSSSKPNYPVHWSPRVPDIAVTDFSGHYNAALADLLSGRQVIQKDTSRCPFHFIINPAEIKYREECPTQNDTISTGYLPISNPDFILKPEQKKEGLQINYKPRHIAGNPVAGYQREYLLLSKAVDGSLIVEKVGKVYGLAFMIFPVAAYERHWYQFYDGEMEVVTGD